MLIKNYWNAMPRFIQAGICLLALSLANDGRADALGATDSIEIAKLTEIITQMTALIERTEKYIDLQRRLAETQERAFFRKSETYAREVRRLVRATDQLERAGRSISSDPLKLNAMYQDALAIRNAATTANGNTRAILLGLADTLDMLARTEWLTGTADAAMQEMATKQDASAEGQLLAGIYRALAEMRRQDVNTETRYRMRAFTHQQQMMGMYSTFNHQP